MKFLRRLMRVLFGEPEKCHMCMYFEHPNPKFNSHTWDDF